MHSVSTIQHHYFSLYLCRERTLHKSKRAIRLGDLSRRLSRTFSWIYSRENVLHSHKCHRLHALFFYRWNVKKIKMRKSIIIVAQNISSSQLSINEKLCEINKNIFIFNKSIILNIFSSLRIFIFNSQRNSSLSFYWNRLTICRIDV